ncbi:beta-1,3-galactosyltransferase brn-like [Onthophagus taurus]|uniref:beta-1,3-galactosyltransferase brn-like n=1 Tax=Onthophagus taurus TaxID=166361 RepID=UPI000C20A3B8|nr:beta-1,3-galactosyltransferase brn-like [Onthophagus taurus]
MYKIFQKNFKYIILIIALITFVLSGYFDYIREISFEKFTYPLEEDIRKYIEELKANQKSSRNIINEYKYDYLITPNNKCLINRGEKQLRLVLVIKSSLDHFERRKVIRDTWGDENRFEIRRFFMVGKRDNTPLNEIVQNESYEYDDIIQGDFIDAYYNNTIKTMMSFKWLLKNCGNSDFYMFVDDDYYVSMPNALNYINNPITYPNYHTDLETNRVSFDLKHFYSGNCIRTRPMRDYFSKYRLSLKEYPFNEFPLYSTAGAYILARDTLEELYYASYYTKHFRFDDVYMGILSRKIGIIPYHTEYISREWKEDENFKRYCIASHGFENMNKMRDLWKNQKELGYA